MDNTPKHTSSHSEKDWLTTLSDGTRHFFHVVSRIRPIIWILIYVGLIPVFALIYYILPDAEFHIPSDGGTSYGSWLYYSTVTITTLGFGDYTPAHGWAQAVTAIEVICGLSIFGFFLNAVGALRSEREVSSAMARQQVMHEEMEKTKLLKHAPLLLHKINRFLAYCYVMTTPTDKRTNMDRTYNKDFTFQDMRDMYQPSGLPFDSKHTPALDGFLRCCRDTALYLDSLQTRVDMTLWPQLLEDCFTFVANTQLLDAQNNILSHPERLVCDGDNKTVCDARKIIADRIKNWQGPAQVTETNPLNPAVELYFYIKGNAEVARRIEMIVTGIASA